VRRRLAFILFLALPAIAAAQNLRTVGVLTPHRDDPNWPAFFETLKQLGYSEGRNLHLIFNSADKKYDRLPVLAAQLVKQHAEVIVAVNTPGARAAIRATKTIPIVMTIVGDPVGTGFVSNLAHPGGNVTGISNMSGQFAAKRLQLMKELLPGAKRIALLFNPVDPVTAPQIRDTGAAAHPLGVEVRDFGVKSSDALPAAFADMASWHADAAVWLSGQGTAMQAPTSELALRHRFPVMVTQRADVEAGGLISYFPDHAELFRRTAQYVDLILKGAKPGELPVEQPTKFELTVNLKTAKAIGLAVPPSILVQADHVIE
jgi:putative ABC transport system substrate-binding protein